MNVYPSDILDPFFFFKLPCGSALPYTTISVFAALVRWRTQQRPEVIMEDAGTTGTNATFVVGALETQNYVL